MISQSNSTKFLFSATSRDGEIAITHIDLTREQGNHVEGKALAVATLSEVSCKIDSEIAVLDLIDTLIDEADLKSKISAPVFKATDLKLLGKSYIALGNCRYVVMIEYCGEAIDDEEPTPAPGTRAYEIEFGIPSRTA